MKAILKTLDGCVGFAEVDTPAPPSYRMPIMRPFNSVVTDGALPAGHQITVQSRVYDLEYYSYRFCIYVERYTEKVGI